MESCHSCKFWYTNEWIEEEYEGKGLCRRRSPIAPSNQDFHRSFMSPAMFPSTHKDIW